MKTALVIFGMWAILCAGFLWLWIRLMQFLNPDRDPDA